MMWLGSLLLSWYVAHFGSYNATYGSLGAVIGFMVWMWLSTIVVMLRAEIDAEIERRATDAWLDDCGPIANPGGARGAHARAPGVGREQKRGRDVEG